MFAKVFGMGKSKKRYWIQYTLDKSLAEVTTKIVWFEFLENRDIVLNGMIRSKNYKNIRFGQKYSRRRPS